MKLFVAILSVVIVGVFGIYYAQKTQQHTSDVSTSTVTYLNIPYLIEGVSTRLVTMQGSEVASVGVLPLSHATYIGKDFFHDFDGDGRTDVAFFVSQHIAESREYYYLLVAIQSNSGYDGGNAFFLGENISPQSISTAQNTSPDLGVIEIQYVDRMPGEEIGVRPSVGKSMLLQFDSNILRFTEFKKTVTFEPESEQRSLPMTTWTWQKSLDDKGVTFLPKEAGAFTLTFAKDGTFSFTTDCNEANGIYNLDPESLTFSEITLTKNVCEGSQEAVFVEMLEGVKSYRFVEDNELLLQTSKGAMTFLLGE